jgi:hypothetical protein
MALIVRNTNSLSGISVIITSLYLLFNPMAINLVCVYNLIK